MLFRLSCSAAVCAVALFIAAGGHLPRASAQSGAYVSRQTGDVIVRFRPGTSLTGVAAAVGRARTAVQDVTHGSGLVLLHPAAGESVDAAVARLRAEPDVEFAEPNTTVHVTTTPTDPLYASYQWNLPQIGMPAAWDRTTGSASVVVAVLDTGVDATQPDLAGRTVAGYNFIANNTNTADDNFHGTFVAGIIGASANNGTGIAGVCWACMIMPVKVLDATGSGDMFHAAQGIDWAVAHGAKVINMSFGGSVADTGLQTSVNNAWNAGVVLVAAAGNNNGGPVLYPAAFPNVMAIASLSQAGTRSSFSNVGPQLALSAPGENITSVMCACAAYTGGYGTGSGTSFAAPQVAGVAALMASAGITNNATIVNTLESTATDVDAPGFDNNTGWGRVNAAAALAPTYGVTWGANPLPSSMAPGATAQTLVSFTNSGSLTWTNSGANPVNFAYHWKSGACPGAATVAFDGQRTGLPSAVASGGSVTNLMVTVQAPTTTGTYCLVYDLVREGITWFSWQGAATQAATVTVGAPGYAVSWGANTLPSTLAPGATAPVTVSFTNTGSQTWPSGGANPVRFAYHWKSGACPGGGTTSYDGLRTNLPADVAPGGAVTNLSATVQAPASAGTYCLVYDLVREGVTWFSWQGGATQSGTVTVLPVYAVTWGANTLLTTAAPGATLTASVSLTDSGSLAWANSGANPVNFAYHWQNGACPGTTTATWDGVRTALPSPVAAGGSVSGLSVSIVAPSSPGTYCLVYDLVREGVTWFSWQGAATQSATVTVATPVYGITWGANTLPSGAAAGATVTASVSFSNSGSLTWASGGANPVRFAYHWKNGACPGTTTAVWDSNRTALPADVAPGGGVSGLNLSIVAPSSPGTYCLVYDLVREGVTWFSWQGAATQSATVTVS